MNKTKLAQKKKKPNSVKKKKLNSHDRRKKKTNLHEKKLPTLSWEKPTHSREKPGPSRSVHEKKTLKFRENQVSLMRRKPQPAQDNKLDFLSRKIQLSQEKTQPLKPKKKQFSQQKKNLTGDFNKSAQPRKVATSHRFKQPSVVPLFRGLRKAAASCGAQAAWSGVTAAGFVNLPHAARESWLSHQEARLLRFIPNNWGSEGTDHSYRLEKWIHLHQKTTDVAKESATKRAQERTSRRRETWLVPPFLLPHSNLSIISPVRQSLSCCCPTIAFSLGFQRRLPPLTCCPTCSLHQISTVSFFSVQTSLRQHEFTCLAYSSAATSQSLTYYWPDVFLVLSLDLHDSMKRLAFDRVPPTKKLNPIWKKATPSREKKSTQEKIKTQPSQEEKTTLSREKAQFSQQKLSPSSQKNRTHIRKTRPYQKRKNKQLSRRKNPSVRRTRTSTLRS